MIADRFGGKWTSGIGILISSVVTLLMPTAAYLEVKLLIALRIICGISQVSGYCHILVSNVFSLLALFV